MFDSDPEKICGSYATSTIKLLRLVVVQKASMMKGWSVLLWHAQTIVRSVRIFTATFS